MIRIVKHKNIIVKLLTCIEKCSKLEHYNKRFSKWNKFDDIFQELFDKIVFEADGETLSILLIFIVKFVTLDAKPVISRFTDINEIYSAVEKSCREQNLNMFLNLKELREECKSVNNYRIYRWFKKLLSILMIRPIFGLEAKEVLFQIHVSKKKLFFLSLLIFSYILDTTFVFLDMCLQYSNL